MTEEEHEQYRHLYSEQRNSSTFFAGLLDSSTESESSVHPKELSTVTPFKIRCFSMRNLLMVSNILAKRAAVDSWRKQIQVLQRMKKRQPEAMSMIFLRVFYTLRMKVNLKTTMGLRKLNAYSDMLKQKRQSLSPEELKKAQWLARVLAKAYDRNMQLTGRQIGMSKLLEREKYCQKMAILMGTLALVLHPILRVAVLQLRLTKSPTATREQSIADLPNDSLSYSKPSSPQKSPTGHHFLSPRPKHPKAQPQLDLEAQLSSDVLFLSKFTQKSNLYLESNQKQQNQSSTHRQIPTKSNSFAKIGRFTDKNTHLLPNLLPNCPVLRNNCGLQDQGINAQMEIWVQDSYFKKAPCSHMDELRFDFSDNIDVFCINGVLEFKKIVNLPYLALARKKSKSKAFEKDMLKTEMDALKPRSRRSIEKKSRNVTPKPSVSRNSKCSQERENTSKALTPKSARYWNSSNVGNMIYTDRSIEFKLPPRDMGQVKTRFRSPRAFNIADEEEEDERLLRSKSPSIPQPLKKNEIKMLKYPDRQELHRTELRLSSGTERIASPKVIKLDLHEDRNTIVKVRSAKLIQMKNK